MKAYLFRVATLHRAFIKRLIAVFALRRALQHYFYLVFGAKTLHVTACHVQYLLSELREFLIFLVHYDIRFWLPFIHTEKVFQFYIVYRGVHLSFADVLH